jgi:hypothetical protein
MNTLPASSHPAPHRERYGRGALAFGLFAAPLAWAIQLTASYAVTGVTCNGARYALDAPTLHTALATVDVMALAVTVAAFVVAWLGWRATREEAAGSAHHLLDAGEGRTRFLAVCGMMASAGFMLALIFATVGIAVVPPCAGAGG